MLGVIISQHSRDAISLRDQASISTVGVDDSNLQADMPWNETNETLKESLNSPQSIKNDLKTVKVKNNYPGPVVGLCVLN